MELSPSLAPLVEPIASCEACRVIVVEPWWVFPGVIEADACRRIVELGLAQPLKRGTGRDIALAEDQRYTDVAWISDDWVYDLIEPWAHRANRAAGWRHPRVAAINSFEYGSDAAECPSSSAAAAAARMML